MPLKSGVGSTVGFFYPIGLCFDNNNVFYVINYNGYGIHKLYYPSAVGSVLASSEIVLTIFNCIDSFVRFEWCSNWMWCWFSK